MSKVSASRPVRCLTSCLLTMHTQPRWMRARKSSGTCTNGDKMKSHPSGKLLPKVSDLSPPTFSCVNPVTFLETMFRIAMQFFAYQDSFFPSSPGPCPVGFSITPRTETLQSPLNNQLDYPHRKHFLSHLHDISCVLVCAYCLLSYHWAPPRRACLHLLYFSH